MGLNTPATPQKYLTIVLIFSAVRTQVTSCTSSKDSLNHSFISAFPLIESLVHHSQTQNFDKVMIEQPPAEFDGYIYACLCLFGQFFSLNEPPSLFHFLGEHDHKIREVPPCNN